MGREWEYVNVRDNITIKYDACSHCGRLPTEQDIVTQMKVVEDHLGGPCVICGKKSRVKEMCLFHSKDEDMDRWGGQVLMMEEFVELTGYHSGLSIRVRMHPACLMNAMPVANLNLLCEKIPQR